ncbi:MAG: hypothetical protein N2560_08765 [Ignavibacteria bacterium]|nr:hypothetical protein [Ignavibacteria bacterium]
MIGKETQNIEVAITKKVSAIFTDRMVFQKVAEELAEKIKKLILERILAGYDLESRKFGNYNVSYNKKYAFKYASKKFGTTQFASSSTKDKLRLTGRLLSSIDVKPTGLETQLRKVNMNFLVFLNDPTQIPKAIGLQSTTGVARNRTTYAKKAYTFLGLAVRGPWRDRENREIQKFLLQKLEDVITNKIKVKV